MSPREPNKTRCLSNGNSGIRNWLCLTWLAWKGELILFFGPEGWCCEQWACRRSVTPLLFIPFFHLFRLSTLAGVLNPNQLSTPIGAVRNVSVGSEGVLMGWTARTLSPNFRSLNISNRRSETGLTRFSESPACPVICGFRTLCETKLWQQY